EQSTASLAVVDSIPAAAPELAVSTASADPDVSDLLVIPFNTATPTSNTATPTSAPECCDCGGGCFQDSGNGCGDCTAVSGAACIDSGCATFTPTPTSTATGTATSTGTATATPTASPSATATPTASRPTTVP